MELFDGTGDHGASPSGNFLLVVGVLDFESVAAVDCLDSSMC